MSVHASLVGLLKTPEITAVVGDRIYPGYLEEGKDNYPAIVYQREGTTRDRTMAGDTGQIDGQYTLSCFCSIDDPSAYDRVWELFDLVRQAISSFNGTPDAIKRSRMSSVLVRRIFVDNERDVIFAPAAGEGVAALGVSCDLQVAFYEVPAAPVK